MITEKEAMEYEMASMNMIQILFYSYFTKLFVSRHQRRYKRYEQYLSMKRGEAEYQQYLEKVKELVKRHI